MTYFQRLWDRLVCYTLLGGKLKLTRGFEFFISKEYDLIIQCREPRRIGEITDITDKAHRC